MASLVGICNASLQKVGGNTILSLTENSEEARHCNTRYQEIMDALLQSHPWNFSIHRATLTPLTTAPNHEWDYQFLLPTNPYCLRTLELGEQYPYKVEGRNILCNYTPIDIKYVKRVADVNQLSPLFREVFSLYLASELAYPIAGSASLKGQLLQEAAMLLRRAQSMDALEDTPDNFRDGSWFTVRGNRSSRYVVARRY